MIKSDKTEIYSDDKTGLYGDEIKRVKESVHNIYAGDEIILNNNLYTIIDIISESTGEAIIYKIKNEKGDFFVLKLYYEFNDYEYEPNEEALSRIKDINDPDILNLYDYGTGINKYENKYCFEILDYAYGHDMLNVENLKETYNVDFITNEVIPQIYKGILTLHENRIYHCDLKPQNVFYLDEEHKEIVIGDYGSAKTFGFDSERDSRKTTTVKGTDFYLPPEQARGFISEKNDYYSFGMILLHLLYPDQILLDANDAYSISRQKLKRIVERLFEAKPIIDYKPENGRINKLIEGLTLLDFNKRWGETEVQKWIAGEQVNISHINYRSESLIFGDYTITAPNDLKEYILNDDNWYVDLIEDEYNRADFTKWMLDYYRGNKSKRSEFNRLVKHYSQEGLEYISEAVIRFFIPDSPLTIGLKSFDFTSSENIKPIVAKAFAHLIFDLWDAATEEDIKLYLFKFEFALRQIKHHKSEINTAVKSLYKNLNIVKLIDPDFDDYLVHAYTKVNKDSTPAIEEFLIEFLNIDVNLTFLELDRFNNLHFSVEKSLNQYYLNLEINVPDIPIKTEKLSILLLFPENKGSLEEFTRKVIDNFQKDLKAEYPFLENITEKSLKKLKEHIENALVKRIEFTENQLSDLNSEYRKEIRSVDDLKDEYSSIKDYLKNIDLSESGEITNRINNLRNKIEKVAEAGSIFKICKEEVNKSSQAFSLIQEAKSLLDSDSYIDIEKAYDILTQEHKFIIDTLKEVADFKEHKEIHFRALERVDIIDAEGYIEALTVSSQGDYIAVSANLNEVVKIVSPVLKKVVFQFTDLKYSVANISINNTGDILACTGTYDHRTEVLDLYEGKRTFILKSSGNKAREPKFNPNGKILAVSDYSEILLWDIQKKGVIKRIRGGSPFCFHPTENYLITSHHSEEVEMINLDSEETYTISGEHNDGITEICVNYDGSLLATGANNDIVRLWDTRTGELLHSLSGHPQYQDCYLCFSPDGKILGSVLNSRAVRLWDLETGKPVLSVTGFESVENICFHPGGESLIIASEYNLLIVSLKHIVSETSEMTITDFLEYEKKLSKEIINFKTQDGKKTELIKAEKEYWKGLEKQLEQKEKMFGKSYKEALKHYKKAAESGHKNAIRKVEDLS